MLKFSSIWKLFCFTVAGTTVRLRRGMQMPQLGLGSGDLDGREGREAICTALRAGRATLWASTLPFFFNCLLLFTFFTPWLISIAFMCWNHWNWRQSWSTLSFLLHSFLTIHTALICTPQVIWHAGRLSAYWHGSFLQDGGSDSPQAVSICWSKKT